MIGDGSDSIVPCTSDFLVLLIHTWIESCLPRIHSDFLWLEICGLTEIAISISMIRWFPELIPGIACGNQTWQWTFATFLETTNPNNNSICRGVPLFESFSFPWIFGFSQDHGLQQPLLRHQSHQTLAGAGAMGIMGWDWMSSFLAIWIWDFLPTVYHGNIMGISWKYDGNIWIGLPSGKLSCNYGKSLFLMRKSTISMAIFDSYVSLPEGTLW